MTYTHTDANVAHIFPVPRVLRLSSLQLTLPVESNGAGRCMGIVPVGDSSVAVGDSEGHILFVDVKQAKVYRNVYDPGKRTENMQRPAIVDDVLVGASVDGYIRVWRLR